MKLFMSVEAAVCWFTRGYFHLHGVWSFFDRRTRLKWEFNCLDKNRQLVFTAQSG